MALLEKDRITLENVFASEINVWAAHLLDTNAQSSWQGFGTEILDDDEIDLFIVSEKYRKSVLLKAANKAADNWIKNNKGLPTRFHVAFVENEKHAPLVQNLNGIVVTSAFHSKVYIKVWGV